MILYKCLIIQREIFFRNLEINRHVGGYQPPQLESTNQYIQEQQKILKDNNIDLPPNVRYFQNKTDNAMNNNQSAAGGTLSYRDYLNNTYAPGCCGKSDSSIYNNFNANGSYNQPNKKMQPKDVYLRNDANRYDPYKGYLYKEGLMSDGHQMRLIQSAFIDINSIFRDITPSIIVDEPILLINNPLLFTNNSNILFINHANSGFVVNDHITISGVVSKSAILRTFRGTNLPTFEIPAGCNFMKIYYTHNIPLTYTGNNISISISGIQGDRGATTPLTFLGSMPINIINSTFVVLLTLTDSEILCTTASVEQSTSNPSYFTPNAGYFFVILPVVMQVVPNATPYTLRDYNFQLIFQSLYGIPLNQINATYPVSPSNLFGFQTITSVTSTGYTIVMPTNAAVITPTATGGGVNVYVGLVTTINTGYPNPNNYQIDIGDVYHDIIAVRLVSSEIPNTEKAIKDNTYGNANNKLYWNDIDDGDYLYSIAVPAGNYGVADLITALGIAFADVPRINAVNATQAAAAGITYTSNHFIQTTINQNTNVVTFASFKEFIVNNPISEIIPDIPDSSVITVNPNINYQLTIDQPGHGMTIPGLTILIQGAIDDKGIPAAIINGEHIVTQIIDANTYRITLPKFNLLSDRTETGGGVNVFIYIPDTFRMLFNQQDTLGTVLGFRNPGAPTSITNFGTTVSNSDQYAFEVAVNSLGQPITITNNALQLSGDNYIVMVADPIQTFYTLGKVRNAFAKIILCGSPGDILYNTFVSMFHIFDNPLHELHNLTITFYAPDGTLFDFSGVDHSFTLEVVTILDIPQGTGISANTGKNYSQTVQN